MFFDEDVGIFAVVPIDIVLAVQVEAHHIAGRHRSAENVGRRRQPGFKADDAQIGQVLDVARCLRHQQRRVRGHPDLIVVGYHQPEFYLDDLGLVSRGSVDETRAIEVVEQADLVVAVGLDIARPGRATLYHGFKADLAARIHAAIPIGDEDVRARWKIRCATHAIVRRVVAQGDFDAGDGAVLALGQRSGYPIAQQSLFREGIGLVGVGSVDAEFDEVADLHLKAPPDQGGGIGAAQLLIGDAARGTGLRVEERAPVLVHGKVKLHAVEARFGQHHGRQGGAQIAADGQRVGVLPLLLRGHSNLGKPVAKVLGLEQYGAEFLGVGLGYVVYQPALIEEIAKGVVEVIPLDVGTDIPMIGLSRVVGGAPLPPVVFGDQLLGHVPAAHRRVEGLRAWGSQRLQPNLGCGRAAANGPQK